MSESTPAKPAAASPSSAPVTKVIPRGTSTSLLYTIAVVLSSLVFALPVTVGRVVEAILDSTNPDGIKDTGAGLAYLGPILGWAFGVLGVLLLVVIVVYALIYRRERTLDALKLPLIVVAIQIVLGVLALIFTQFTNASDMPDEVPPDTSRLQLAAALLASSVIGAPLVIATAVQTILFTINPRDLGVSHPLAYAAEIAGAFGLSALGAIVAVAIVLSRLRDRAESRAVLRVPYMILALQIAFAVVAFALFMFTPVL